MKKTIAIFALFLAAFTWGSAFCVLKDTLENVSPIWLLDRKSTRLNSSHLEQSRMPSSA